MSRGSAGLMTGKYGLPRRCHSAVDGDIIQDITMRDYRNSNWFSNYEEPKFLQNLNFALIGIELSYYCSTCSCTDTKIVKSQSFVDIFSLRDIVCIVHFLNICFALFSHTRCQGHHNIRYMYSLYC